MEDNATTFEEIYERFLSKVTDFDLAMLPENDLHNMLKGFLLSAIAKFRKCKSDLSDRDEELEEFNVGLEDVEKEILALMMVVEWITPQLNSTLFTKQVFSGSDLKFYSQAAHIDQLQLLKENSQLEAKKLMRDYTYSNGSYWDDE